MGDIASVLIFILVVLLFGWLARKAGVGG